MQSKILDIYSRIEFQSQIEQCDKPKVKQQIAFSHGHDVFISRPTDGDAPTGGQQK